MISKAKRLADFKAFGAKIEGLVVTGDIDGETVTGNLWTAVKETGALLAEGESIESERFIRFPYDEVSTVPTPNASIFTYDNIEYTIVDVTVDTGKVTIKCKLEEQYANI